MTAHQKRLQEVLNAYGRNPLRWPQADRVRFAHLLQQPDQVPTSLGDDADQLDKLLDLAGPQAIVEPQGAKARLLQRMATEMHQPRASQADVLTDVGWRRVLLHPQALMSAGMLAASIIVGVFVGINDETGALLSDSLNLASSGDELQDVVLLDEAEDGGLL